MQMLKAKCTKLKAKNLYNKKLQGINVLLVLRIYNK